MTVTKIKLDLKCDTDGCDNMVESGGNTDESKK